MSGTLQRLVLLRRHQRQSRVASCGAVASPPRPSGSLLCTSPPPSSVIPFGERSSSIPRTGVHFPFPSIQHYNIVLGEAIKRHRWGDVAVLEDMLAPHCVSPNGSAVDSALTSSDFDYRDDPAASHSGDVQSSVALHVRPSVETFQLLMAGRLQIGDWEGSLGYFVDAQHEMLPVPDATVRMALRAYRSAEAPYSVWKAALGLFRSFQHRVCTADTAEIIFDVLFDAGRMRAVLDLYKEVRHVMPLDVPTLALVVEAAKRTGEWVLAMQLASSAVSSPISSDALQPIVASGLGAALQAHRFVHVQECIRQLVRRRPDLVDEDSCLVGARAAAAAQHPPTILEVVEFLHSRKEVFQNGAAVLHDAQNLALVGLHNAVARLSQGKDVDDRLRQTTAVFSAAHAVQQLIVDDEHAGMVHRDRITPKTHWTAALAVLRQIRNVDAVTVLRVVSLLRSQSQWETAVSVLNHSGDEHDARCTTNADARKKSAVVSVDVPQNGRWTTSSPITVWALDQVIRAMPHDNGDFSLRAAALLQCAVERQWITRAVGCALLGQYNDASHALNTSSLSVGTAAWVLEALESNHNCHLVDVVASLGIIARSTSTVTEAGNALLRLVDVCLTTPSPQTSPPPSNHVHSKLKHHIELELLRLASSSVKGEPLPALQAIQTQPAVQKVMEVAYPKYLVAHGRYFDAVKLLHGLSRLWIAPSIALSDPISAPPGLMTEVVDVLFAIPSAALLSTGDHAAGILSLLPPLVAQLMEQILREPSTAACVSSALAKLFHWIEPVALRHADLFDTSWILGISNIAVRSLSIHSTAHQLVCPDLSHILATVVRCISAKRTEKEVLRGGGGDSTAVRRILEWMTIGLRFSVQNVLVPWFSDAALAVIPAWLETTLRTDYYSDELLESFLKASLALPESAPHGVVFSCLRLYFRVSSVTAMELGKTSQKNVVKQSEVALVVRWMKSLSRSRDEGVIADRVMDILTLTRHLPATEMLLLAHTQCGRAAHPANSTAVVRCVTRVYRTWLLEGRSVPITHLHGLLALPSTHLEFGEAWRVLQAALHSSSSDAQCTKEFVVQALRVIKLSPQCCANAVRLFQELSSSGSRLIKDVSVCNEFLSALAAQRHISEEDLHVLCSGDICIWKCLVWAPHGIAVAWGDGYFWRSAVFRVLLRVALSRRPQSTWRLVLAIVERCVDSAVANHTVIDAQQHRDACVLLNLIGSSAPVETSNALQLKLDRLSVVEGNIDRSCIPLLVALSRREIDDAGGLCWERMCSISDAAKRQVGQSACALLTSSTPIPLSIMYVVVNCWACLGVASVGVHINVVHPSHREGLWRCIEQSWKASNMAASPNDVIDWFSSSCELLAIVECGAKSVHPHHRHVPKGISKSIRHGGWDGAALAHTILDVLISGTDSSKRFSTESDRRAAVDACIALGRWRTLATVLIRWKTTTMLAAGNAPPILVQNSSQTIHPSMSPLLYVVAAAWSTGIDLFREETVATLCGLLVVGEDVPHSATGSLGTNELKHLVRVTHAAVRAAARRGAVTAFNPLSTCVASAEYFLLNDLTPTPIPDGSTNIVSWVKAVQLVTQQGISPGDDAQGILTHISQGSNGAISAYALLSALAGPHVPSRVPIGFCLGAVNTCPGWVEGLALLRRSVASLPGPPMSVQRYIAILILERMRQGSIAMPGQFSPASVLNNSKGTLCWETAAALFTLTASDFRRFPQRFLTEALRHSYRNPAQVRFLFNQFRANKYARVEGINHLLTLLRCAKENNAPEFLYLVVEELMVLASRMSSSNRGKLVVEIGQTARQILPSVSAFEAFRDGLVAKLSQSESELLMML